MLPDPQPNERRLIKYRPLQFSLNYKEYEPAPETKWEEMIFRNGRWYSWTGSYRIYSSNAVELSEVLDQRQFKRALSE